MSSRRIEDLDIRIQSLVTELLNRANEVTTPWKTFITDGFRTYAEQAALYAQGRTTAGKIVTNAKPGTSNHEKGLAVDIAFQNGGKLSYDENLYKKIVPIAKSLGFDWGGDWSGFPDKPHFEKLQFKPTDPPVTTHFVFTDQTKIPVGGTWGEVELQAIRGLLGDLNRYRSQVLELEAALSACRNQNVPVTAPTPPQIVVEEKPTSTPLADLINSLIDWIRRVFKLG